MADEIADLMGPSFRRGRFIPYVELHEFEALLFSDIEDLTGVLCASLRPYQAAGLQHGLQAIVGEAGCPEAINNRPGMSPSHRLKGLAPFYRKTVHGPVAAGRIGLEKMSLACPHFAAWLGQLEAAFEC
jgi:hypothetical protein